MILNQHVKDKRLEFRTEFESANNGIRHVVVDRFLSDDVLRELQGVFPLRGSDVTRYRGQVVQRKFEAHPSLVFPPDSPLMHGILGGEIADWVRCVTSANDAYVPATLPGGGLHETRAGGFLGMHTDNFHLGGIEDPRLYNLIVYLTPNWNPDWEGALYIGPKSAWKRKGDHRKPEFRKIDVRENRALLFETTPESLHGHPERLTCPEDTSRRSLSLWYYVPSGYRPRSKTSFIEESPLYLLGKRVNRLVRSTLKRGFRK